MQARSIRSKLNIHPKLCLKEVYFMFWIELLIVLVMIFIGTRKGAPYLALTILRVNILLQCFHLFSVK